MSETLITTAEQALEAALATSGARDPRDFYRERLRELKQVNPESYRAAVTYYREVLIPEVAGGAGNPLDAWIEYGRTLAEALAPGRTVSIDETGKSHNYEGVDSSGLILHLPQETGARALLVSLPVTMSSAQRATYDVLVKGKQRAQEHP
ncbi:MAG: hypothetical protein VX801_03460 [Gemmatimonadota bacterium]|nr:hypothetical protein [Gemmatimonadota bacterium]|tara:strand:- start:57 stop:506 length:450 start_codon:yes stop_codon:yes gene_type:complete